MGTISLLLASHDIHAFFIPHISGTEEYYFINYRVDDKGISEI